MKKILLLLSLFIGHAVHATVYNFDANSFVEIESIYTSHYADHKNTLFVFDLDDTLFTTYEPLGSVGWWEWQKGLLKNDAANPLLFAQSYDDLIRIQGILYNMIKMQPTEADAPRFLKAHANNQFNLLALTARGIDVEEATRLSLMDTGYNENNATLFATHGVRLRNGNASSAGPLACETVNRSIYLRDGILFTAGQNKGQVLACLLKQSKTKYSQIIFVDDTLKNNQDMDRAFQDNGEITVVNVHYTRELSKEEGFIHDSAQQQTVYQQWQNLKNSIHENIPHSQF